MNNGPGNILYIYVMRTGDGPWTSYLSIDGFYLTFAMSLAFGVCFIDGSLEPGGSLASEIQQLSHASKDSGSTRK